MSSRSLGRTLPSSRFWILPLSVLGSSLAEFDDCRDHEVFEMARAVAQQLALGQLASGSSTTKALTASPEQRVGHADHRRLGHARMAIQDVLDFLRAHLLAAALDDVVLAADEIEIAVLGRGGTGPR